MISFEGWNKLSLNQLRVSSVLAAMLLSVSCRPGETPPRGPQPAPAEREPAPTPVRPPTERPLRLGVILPRSGSPDLAQYGDLVRQGIELAVAEYTRNGGPTVELIVLDDAGDTRRAAQQVAQLDSAGAVAILGPLMSQAMDAAVANRRDRHLVILSPTASVPPASADHAYSLNADDTRGAEMLARHAIGRGLTRLAVLHPTTPDAAILSRAFANEARRTDGVVVLDLPFDPGTTTFAGPMNRLLSSRTQAVYVPATERDIRQLAPQFAYYGLTGIQILGSDAWASDQVLRMVQPNLIEGVVVAIPLQRDDPNTAWSEFVALYERTHRRTLDNPYPALGYDAASVVLSALAAGHTRRRDLADAVDGTSRFRGATGILSFRDGRVSREPFLVRIQSGRLAPVSGPGGA